VFSLIGPTAILFIFGLLGSAAGGSWVTHRFDAARYESLKASYANAQADAMKQAADLRTRYEERRQSEAAAWNQQKQILVQRARTANRKVERYVKERPGSCITYGALRLLDGSGVLGIEPERLPLPAGKSDDSCAPLTAVIFYRSVLENFSACRQNSAQLDALIGNLRSEGRK
jgi:ElaB/YqjD/DUF883 family membrane-anchored ribosome-binding protein